ncbi:ankyrin repeat-containing domain protein [Aspergillus carlsbadensis]|nr:ankyrin repeat-containing domain protein [Aspergillus carlsbadensis]
MAESGYSAPDGNDADSSQSELISHDEHALRLSLLEIVEAQEGGNTIVPDIDIIHVTGVTPDERLGLNTIVPDTQSKSFRKREFVFRCDIAGFLLGDLSTLSVQHQALSLLRGLILTEDDGKKSGHRARIFVSYDLGALVVKKAIAIASNEESRWPGVFASAMQFIFSSCFQRRQDLQSLDTKLLEFLRAQKNNEQWASRMTPITIRGLADASVETTELFLNSRITLTSRVVSIYGRDAHTTVNVFDSFTATLDIPTEFVASEGSQTKTSFPTFDDLVYYKARSTFSNLISAFSSFSNLVLTCHILEDWSVDEKLASIWRILVPLVAPHPFVTIANSLDPSHSVFTSDSYQSWKAVRKSQILYIQGRDHEDSKRQAQQVFLSWQADLQAREKHQVPVIPFYFSSRDPLRDSMKSALCAVILQILCAFPDDADSDRIRIFVDQYRVQKGWTTKDLLNLFSMTSLYYFGDGGLLVLYDVDECETDSRRAFWDFLRYHSEISEAHFKVVVTSRHKFGLQEDLNQSGLWTLYDTSAETAEEPFTQMDKNKYLEDTMSRLLPCNDEYIQMQEALQRIAAGDQPQSSQILRLLEDHTTWPRQPSARSLSRFGELLLAVQPSSTVADVLDNILRSTPDQAGLQWALCWLIYGHQPINSHQLALLLYYGKQQGDKREPRFSTEPLPLQVEESLQLLRTWLSGLARFGSDQISIHDHIWDILLETDSRYVWNEVKTTAYSTMLDFSISYLTHQKIQDRLSTTWEQYLSAYNAADLHIAPPVLSHGNDILLYVVAALSHILSWSPEAFNQLEPLLALPGDPLALWAKMHWTISNPFSRPGIDTVNSTLSVLDNMENLDPRLRTSIKDRVAASVQCESSSISKESLTSDSMNLLLRAIQLGDEDAALSHARQITLSHQALSEVSNNGEDPLQETKSAAPLWPANLLWRATWLNMDRLTSLLLETQSPDPDSDSSMVLPSPLYMASHLGHDRIVELLLKAGANIRTLRDNTYGVAYTAAGRGHSKCLRLLLAQDPELLELRLPAPPLYQATVWGGREAVETLLELGANPNSRESVDEWASIVAAADSGYLRTLRTLLQNNADPNTAGPGEVDTPLWFAAIRAGSVECVQALLEHGADPNHELLKPHLLFEIERTSMVTIENKIAILDVLADNVRPIDIDARNGLDKTALMYAAELGDVTMVKWLLAHNADLNATDHANWSPLRYAVNSNQKEIVREMLKHGPNLNIKDTDGDTALMRAASHDAELVEMLLDAGADPEIENGSELTAINVAVTSEKSEIVRLLVNRKANINHKDTAEWAPIHDASGYVPNAEIVRILAEGGADLKSTAPYVETALHKAVGKEHVDILAVLLEFHTSIDLEQRNSGGSTPLNKAARTGNVDCMRRLLQAGADINSQDSDGWTVLIQALNSEKATEAVTFLLRQPGLDISRPSIGFGAALHVACRFLNKDVVTMLLDHGADAGQQTSCLWATPLMAACLPTRNRQRGTRSDDLDKMDEIVRLLRSRGADVNDQCGTGIPNALCAAALGSSIRTITYLINEGASPKTPGWLDRLPIHYAAINGIDNFQAVFISEGDISAPDRAGKLALHWAAQFGHSQTVQRILAYARTEKERYDLINRADVDGWTALCWALRPTSNLFDPVMYSEPYDLTETVRVLLDRGADVSIKCRMGREDEVFSPLELARLHGAGDEIIQMLEEAERAHPSEAEPRRSVMPYTKAFQFCDICLNIIWGPVWRCEVCPCFDACKKCYGNILLYHGNLKQDDGEPHAFKLHVHAGPEIQEQSPPSSPKQEANPVNHPTKSQSSPGSGQGSPGDELDDVIYEVLNDHEYVDNASTA